MRFQLCVSRVPSFCRPSIAGNGLFIYENYGIVKLILNLLDMLVVVPSPVSGTQCPETEDEFPELGMDNRGDMGDSDNPSG